jgi:hypothetical protein
MPERKRYLDWSELLKRTFARDVLVCEKCGGRKRVVAFVAKAAQALAMLEVLGIADRSLADAGLAAIAGRGRDE